MTPWELATTSPKDIMFEVPAVEQPSCAHLEVQAGELPLAFQEGISTTALLKEHNKTGAKEEETNTQVILLLI